MSDGVDVAALRRQLREWVKRQAEINGVPVAHSASVAEHVWTEARRPLLDELTDARVAVAAGLDWMRRAETAEAELSELREEVEENAQKIHTLHTAWLAVNDYATKMRGPFANVMYHGHFVAEHLRQLLDGGDRG